MVGKRNLNAREGADRPAMPEPVCQHVRTEVPLSYYTGVVGTTKGRWSLRWQTLHGCMGAHPASVMAPKGEYMLVG